MNLTRISAAIALTLGLSVSVLADGTPVCNPDPGILQTPPCASAQIVNDEATTPLENSAPSTDVSAISWGEATLDIVQTLLTIY